MQAAQSPEDDCQNTYSDPDRVHEHINQLDVTLVDKMLREFQAKTRCHSTNEKADLTCSPRAPGR